MGSHGGPGVGGTNSLVDQLSRAAGDGGRENHCQWEPSNIKKKSKLHYHTKQHYEANTQLYFTMQVFKKTKNKKFKLRIYIYMKVLLKNS